MINKSVRKVANKKSKKEIKESIPRKTVLKWMGIVLTVALLFRLVALNSLPPGLHPDEAANGLDIVERILKGDHRIIYDTNSARESLFFYLQAVPVKIFGNTIFALRLAPAILGSLSAVLAYLSMRAWFKERTGRIAGILVGILPWSVVLSRDGYRASMMPLFIFGTLWAAARAYQTRSYRWAAGAGVLMSLGLYTYLSYRIFFAVVALGAFGIFIKSSKWRANIAVTGAAALLTAMPLFVTWAKHPAYLGARSETSVLKQEDPAKAMTDSVIKNAEMFVIKGDENPRHNITGWPALNPLLFVAFTAGLVMMVRWRSKKLGVLLLFFGSMMVPGLIAAEGAPHYLRQYGAFPFMVAFTAVGLDYLVSRFTNRNKLLANQMIYGALVVTAIGTVFGYFFVWGNSTATKEAYYYESVSVAKEMNKLAAANDQAMMYTYIGGYENITVRYLTWEKAKYEHVYPEYTRGDRKFEGTNRIVVDASGGNLERVVDRQNLPANKYVGPVENGKTLYIIYSDEESTL